MDLHRFAISRVIVHEIPKRPPLAAIKQDPSADTEPVLSAIESPLTPEFRAYLESRVKQSVATAAYPAAYRPETASSVPHHVEALLADQGGDLVTASQAMAAELHAAQRAVNPSGLFVVATGQVGSRAAVIVLKLEKEEGVRIEPKQVQGKQTFAFVLERELVMTENTKVFKTGIFRAADPTEPAARTEVVVADHQTGFQGGAAVARFFLVDFLGCDVLHSPDLETKKVFDIVEKWANETIEDPVVRTDYQLALLAEMRSQRDAITPSQFIRDNVRVEHRDVLQRAFDEAEVPNRVQRDTALIDHRIRQLQMRFKSGITVLATQEQFDDGLITVANEDDGKARVTITDSLRDNRGH